MNRQLVIVHGRAQQQKDSIALKAEWLEALAEGLAKSKLKLPIAETDVRFPYYGDTLYDLAEGETLDEAAKIIVRGEGMDADEEEFVRAIMEEIRKKADISTEELVKVASQEVVHRGPLEWEWFQAFLRAVDRYVPYGSGTSIALFTNDVYQYLSDTNIRTAIDDGVSDALTDKAESVVVAHSLGTVVAYNLLRLKGVERGWKVPHFITVGSPLAVTEIKKSLKKVASLRCPECVSNWFNALDERDIVALYPLDPECFPIKPAEPAIINRRNVRNKTDNRHGIAGYLDNKEVAKRIYDALVAE